MFKRKSPKAKSIPQLVVKDAAGTEISRYDLVDEKYLLGSDPQKCQIAISDRSIGGVHLSIRKDKMRGRGFIIFDEGSTEGIYRGKKKIDKASIFHGNEFTLGKPNLDEVLSIVYEHPPTTRQKVFRSSIYGIGGLLGLGLLAFAVETSKVDVSTLPEASGPVVIYAENDLQTPLYQKKGVVYGQASDYSPWIRKAILAKEDSNFYWHSGIDPIGIIRASLINIGNIGKKGKVSQGASTVSQQLVTTLPNSRRYMFAGSNIEGEDSELDKRVNELEEQYKSGTNRDIGTKLRQVGLALKLDATHSKDSLLVTYMNKVFLSNSYNGFENAAQRYFGKSASKLDLASSALLVGIVNSPNGFSPCKTKDGEPVSARKQQILVLQRMLRAGMITDRDVKIVTGWPISIKNLESKDITIEVEKEKNLNEKLGIISSACNEAEREKRQNFRNFIFKEFGVIQKTLGGKMNIKGNIAIETGMDLKMQEKAESILQRSVEVTGKTKGFKQGAIVTMDSRTGLIKAMVGGVPPNENQTNRATNPFLQSGSTFKLFTYATALGNGIPASKSYSCDPINWDGYNIGGCDHAKGSADMYTGFALSENLTALKIAQEVGLEKIQNTAKEMGIESKLDDGPAMVLGSSDTNVLEMTGAYSAVAAQGMWRKPHAIIRLYDTSDCQDKAKVNSCRVIYDATKTLPTSRQAIKPEVAATLSTLMGGVVTREGATGKNAAIPNMTAVGKTGTSGTEKSNQSLWFIGFVTGKPEVTAVWLGNDTRSESTSGYGADAAQTWSEYMGAILTAAPAPLK
jgi:penicillin-binding protein 1A